MIEVTHAPEDGLVTIRASGKLTGADYDTALPEIEAAIGRADGALNSVIDVTGLEGIELAALWKDLKFDIRHFADFGRIAVVGRSRAQQIGARASGLLTDAELAFFDADAADDARRWAAGG